jgi:2-oxoglutarate ferredoxin oxidoreductase subunit alpha
MVEGGVDPAKLVSVLGYDGSPITARFITDEISRRIRGLARTPTPLVAE